MDNAKAIRLYKLLVRYNNMVIKNPYRLEPTVSCLTKVKVNSSEKVKGRDIKRNDTKLN